MADNLQQRMDQAATGAPLVNPDEQRKYLGTFRERCYVSMTVAQMKKTTNQTLFMQALEHYPEASILMNGSLPTTVQATYMQLATKQQIPFKIVTTASTVDEKSIGLLIVSDVAVHQDVIDIEKRFARKQVESTMQKKPTKKRFWSKIF
ncbi:YueI family protein [Enterococcus sp. LJL98]